MDIECPYCGEEQDINHDDGFGYEESKRHEQECYSCEKTFVFETSISFFYDVSKADCLNGGDHKLKHSFTVPVEYTQWECSDCDYSRQLTKEEVEQFKIDHPERA